MNVVVTGGSGFIGRCLVEALLGTGESVTVLDVRAPDSGDVRTVIGDIRDSSAVDAAVCDGTDAVYHLAAVTSVLASMENPSETYDVNVAATQLLLERARNVGANRFVLASTNAVCGDTGGAVIDEQTALHPKTPYGATKAAGEMLLYAYGSSYGMDCASVRLTNVYGVGMSRKDSFVPRLARAALAPGSPVKIYGDGLQVRDLVYVTDAVAGLVLAGRQSIEGPLVVGAGISYSVLDIHAAMCAAAGADIPVEHVDPKPGEMRAVVVDITRARGVGYSPNVTLGQGLAATWRDWAPVGRGGPEAGKT